MPRLSMIRARTRPPRSTIADHRGPPAHLRLDMLGPRADRSHGYGHLPCLVHLDVARNGPPPRRRSVRIILNIRCAVLYVTPISRSNCFALIPHRVLASLGRSPQNQSCKLVAGTCGRSSRQSDRPDAHRTDSPYAARERDAVELRRLAAASGHSRAVRVEPAPQQVVEAGVVVREPRHEPAVVS